MRDMTADEWKRVHDTFLQAIELPVPAQPEFAVQKLGDSPKLLEYVLRLFDSQADEGDGSESDRYELHDSLIGARLGACTITELIGEGSFGAVYLAEQEFVARDFKTPQRRKVAIKVIKLGMDTRQVVSRFYQERYALAEMNYPGIASVFDAGATPDGRPYFVMEYVPGEPITRFADRRVLTIQARLKLFRDVCIAVEHAHQKGFIHRDLKPSNILVSEDGDRPVAKVIDFGIAKANCIDDSKRTSHTVTGHVLGTPGYMSPEQHQGTGDIDTRTDVYSLGIVLCELLTGTTPHRKSRVAFRNGAIELSPVVPIELMSLTSLLPANIEAIGEISRARGVNEKALRRVLRGELGWIACRAVETDRTRRYKGVHELLNDLERLNRNEPITAAPPSWGYHANKFYRRHRIAVSAAIVAAVSTIAGSALVGRFAWSEAKQRALAERTAENLRAIVQYHTGLLTRLSPVAIGHTVQSAFLPQDQGELPRVAPLDAPVVPPIIQSIDTANVILREHLIQPASRELSSTFPDHPEARAIVRRTLGEMNLAIGDVKQATAEFALAFADNQASCGAHDVRTIDAQVALGCALFLDDQFPSAREHLSQALRWLEQTGNEDHPSAITCLIWLSRLETSLGNYEAAIQVGNMALNRAEVTQAPSSVMVEVLIACSQACRYSGCFSYADRYSMRSVEVARTQLANTPLVLGRALRERSLILQSSGNYEAAHELLPEALALLQASLGQYHPESVLTLATLAESKSVFGDLDGAERDLRFAIEILQRHNRELSRDMAELIAQLGAVLRRQQRFVDAIDCYSRAKAIVADLLGREHMAYAGLLNDIGRAMLHGARNLPWREQAEAAESAVHVLIEAAEVSAKALPVGHINIAIDNDALMWALTTLGRYEEAEQALCRAWQSVSDLPPQRHRFMPVLLDRAIKLYHEWDIAEPGRGHDYQRSEWENVLEEWWRVHERWRHDVPGS